MLGQTPAHEEQAKRFTSLISRRIGLSKQSTLAQLPEPEDYNISNIENIASDIAVIKLYEAALIAKASDEMKHIISGIVWLCHKTSDWMKSYLSIANLDLKDNVEITQTKLIKLDNYNFFYNVFLEHEFVIPVSKFIENYNILKQSQAVTDLHSLEMENLLSCYRKLNILSPEISINHLLQKTKEGIVLKHRFEKLISTISSMQHKLKEPKQSTYDKEQIVEIYRNSASNSEKIDISSIKDISPHDYDNFLIKTSDITLSGKKNKPAKSNNTTSLKRDVLKALKRSNHATKY